MMNEALANGPSSDCRLSPAGANILLTCHTTRSKRNAVDATTSRRLQRRGCPLPRPLPRRTAARAPPACVVEHNVASQPAPANPLLLTSFVRTEQHPTETQRSRQSDENKSFSVAHHCGSMALTPLMNILVVCTSSV